MRRSRLPLLNRLLMLIGLVAGFASSASAESKYAVIYRFPDEDHGYGAYDLVADNAGNLYGTTGYGGRHGFGTAYMLTPPGSGGGAWNRTVLYSFPTGSSVRKSAGAGSLVLDPAGNLYGVTANGGRDCTQFGCGTVFELTPPKAPGSRWTETNLYVFSGWDGYEPGGLVLDRKGNLYGATFGGGRGCSGFGCGTVFMLTPSTHGKAWKRTVLYFFKGVLGGEGDGDGSGPLGVTFDQMGDLYGITRGGGHCDQGDCYGTAFKLKPPTKKGSLWAESVLFRFSWDLDYPPDSGVVIDKSGALYGSTGDFVYQLVLANGVWTQNVVTSGSLFYTGVIVDGAGSLYGTTGYSSQYTNGTVFKLSPPGKGGNWTQTVLHAFAGGSDGADPESGVTFGKGGALYGATLGGGKNTCVGYDGCGTVFRVAP